MPLSNEALEKRLLALEKRQLKVTDLPIAALKKKLAQDPQNASDIFLPNSISSDLLDVDPIIWTNLSLTASWVEYGSGFQTPQVTKNNEGWVFLRGLAKPAATGNHAITTLPEGFRPGKEIGFACSGSHAATGAHERVDVLATGEVLPLSSFAGTSGEYYLFLDGIVFYAEQ